MWTGIGMPALDSHRDTKEEAMKKELHHLSWTLTALLGLLWTSSAAGQFLAPPDKP